MGWDAVLVDGTNLETAARVMQVWEGVHAGAPQRGDLLAYPGRDGQVDTDQPFGPTVLSVGLVVRGGAPDVTGFNDAFRTLRRLCKPGRNVTLTRQLSFAGGNESHTATAKLRSLTPSQLSPADYKVVVEFAVLDGLWHGQSTATLTVPAGSPGTYLAGGDVRTHRMTVTLSGGTNPTLINGTNGHQLTYTGSTATAVDVDVEAMTATQGGTDVSANLSWKKTMPFRLEAGSQLIQLNSGSASIAYYPAYL